MSDLLLLDGADVDRLATVELGLAAAAEAARLAEDKVVTGRVQVNGPLAWIRVLAGTISELDLLGYKEFHRVRNRVHYQVHLFRESTGEPLAIVDGRRITSLRTSSTAAVAVGHRVGEAPVTLALIGSGEEAWEGLRALAGTVQIKNARVFSPTAANREAFARRAEVELSVAVEPLADARDALAGAEVAYIATSSHHEPFLGEQDVADLSVLAAIGSTQPVHRELRGAVFTAFDRVVLDTPDAAHESGDCVEAVADGWDPAGAQVLATYLAKPAPQDRLLFKSIGSVEQDLVLAYHLMRAAEVEGAGRRTSHVASLRLMR